MSDSPKTNVPFHRPPGFDLTAFVVAYEGGELSDEEVVTGFQYLIDSGLAWTLQGSYGRQAQNLIELGLCHLPGSDQPSVEAVEADNLNDPDESD